MQKSNKKYLFIGTTIASIICIITLAILVVTHIVSFLLQEKRTYTRQGYHSVSRIGQRGLSQQVKNINRRNIKGNLHETNKDSGTFKSSTLEIKTPVLPNLSLDEKMTDFFSNLFWPSKTNQCLSIGHNLPTKTKRR